MADHHRPDSRDPVELHDRLEAPDPDLRPVLRALDPSTDAARWDGLALEVARRGLAARLRARTVSGQLQAWGRPLLTAAAAVAALTWTGALLAPVDTRAMLEPAAALSTWAADDNLPPAATILGALGGTADVAR